MQPRLPFSPLCPMRLPGTAAAVALASTLALKSTSARADVVWNVNVGNSSVGTSNAIATTDNYQAADLEDWTEVPIPLTSAGTVTITPGSPSDHVSVAIPDLGTSGFARLQVTE